MMEEGVRRLHTDHSEAQRLNVVLSSKLPLFRVFDTFSLALQSRFNAVFNVKETYSNVSRAARTEQACTRQTNTFRRP